MSPRSIPSKLLQSRDLLATIGGFCDASTKDALRLTSLSWRNALAPTRFRVSYSYIYDFFTISGSFHTAPVCTATYGRWSSNWTVRHPGIQSPRKVRFTAAVAG
jgi:hypothetical protein